MLKVFDNSKKAEDEVTLFYVGICFFLFLGVITLTVALDWVAESEMKSHAKAVRVALAGTKTTAEDAWTNNDLFIQNAHDWSDLPRRDMYDDRHGVLAHPRKPTNKAGIGEAAINSTARHGALQKLEMVGAHQSSTTILLSKL